jgi:mannose-6-phosphate isomerase-like protein (cupin superfamily)
VQQIITKPWGREIVLTEANSPYTSKILELKSGEKLSLQYHDQKIETLTLINGMADIVLGPDVDHLTTTPMAPRTGYTITPNLVHRIVATTDCLIVEASTPETGTTFRLEDDNQRPNETPDIRNLPNRGWDNPANDQQPPSNSLV